MIYRSRIARQGYTHEVFVGTNTFRDLAWAIAQSQHPLEQTREFWREYWPVIQKTVHERMQGTGDPRAILLHYGGWKHGPSDTPWNSLYIASRNFIDNELNCEFFANDYCQACHVNGDWKWVLIDKYPNALFVQPDRLYLTELHPMDTPPKIPSDVAGITTPTVQQNSLPEAQEIVSSPPPTRCNEVLVGQSGLDGIASSVDRLQKALDTLRRLPHAATKPALR